MKGRVVRFVAAFAVAILALGVEYGTARVSAAPGCTTTLMNIVAHEDDDLLFQSPDLLHAVQGGWCVRTVFITAGDAGNDASYWGGRQAGSQAAYAEMAGVANSWTQADAGVAGHPIPVFTLAARPQVSEVFMHLPDGFPDGSGSAAYGSESLEQLWQGSISVIHAVDKSSAYSKQGLINTLTALMFSYQPTQIRVQDYVGVFGDGDHSDHHAGAYFARAAHQHYTTTHTFTGYHDYDTASMSANVTGTDLTGKQNAFYTYTPYDPNVCQTPSACSGGDYAGWIQRQYTVGSENGGGGASPLPTADPGKPQTVTSGAQVTLDGSFSSDPYGRALTYQWTQTGGTAVTLSNTTAAQLTFTAPSSPSTLAFQLVVNDGQVSSNPTSTTVTVPSPNAESNLAGTATVTASSDTPATGQTAAKAVDGCIGGYPGNSSCEWATQGGGAGSWLNLAWAGPVTLSHVVLYDRPNLNDQVTAGTLQFSDGSSVAVGTLPNDGSAYTVTFPSPKTTTGLRFTITAVSATTQNVGLSEFQAWGTKVPPVYSPPVANAGAAQTVASGAQVQLDGTASSDSNGNPLTYQWSQTGGPAVTLSSATVARPTFTAPAGPATLAFQLVVNDGQASSAPSGVTVTVSAPAVNHPPTANAGPNQTVASGAAVTLDGTGSSDPDGNPLTYQWAQTAGPAVALSGVTTPMAFGTGTSEGGVGTGGDHTTFMAADSTMVVIWYDGTYTNFSYARLPYTNWTTIQVVQSDDHALISGFMNQSDDSVEFITGYSPNGYVYYYKATKSGSTYTLSTPTVVESSNQSAQFLPHQGTFIKDTRGRYWLIYLDATGVTGHAYYTATPTTPNWTDAWPATGAPIAPATKIYASVVGSYLVVVYSDNATNQQVYQRVNVSGATLGTWSAVKNVGNNENTWGEYRAFTSNGTVAFYASLDTYQANGIGALQYSIYNPATDTWSAFSRLSENINDEHPNVVTDANGDFYILYSQTTSTSTQINETAGNAIVYKKYTVASGTLSSATTLVPAGGTNYRVLPNAFVRGTSLVFAYEQTADIANGPFTYVAGSLQWGASAATVARPTFTAPAGPATLAFQLVVNDGQASSAPSGVTVTVSAPAVNHPPTANAGPNQTVASGAAVTLDGTGSSDPDGNPLTYQWAQTAGPAVALSSSTVARPTFTAPAGPATLAFQLVVNDGQVNSSPSSVTITVNAPAGAVNVAPSATVTASSDNPGTGQTAAKAVDGCISGWPNNYSCEWATQGGGAGSWLNLAWAGPVTLDHVVLYDRPNLNDQVTAGTLQFSDGTTVAVGTLPNDGSPLTVTFPAKTTTGLRFTITAVSATTQNVGLSEFQAWQVAS